MMHIPHLLLAVIAALTLGLVSAPAVRAENPGPAAAAPPAAEAPDTDPEAYWRAQAENARERVAAAQAELYAVKADVSRMRRRNHPRGEARAAIFASRDAAHVELEAARHHLEVELPLEAEQAGADSDWLRE
jgi:hypothetical protein